MDITTRLALRNKEKSKNLSGKYFNNAKEIEKLIKLDLQQKNKFKLLLIPNFDSFKQPSASSLISSAIGGATALRGNLITTTYLQSVSFPSSFSIEYHDLTKTAKGLVRPEQITLTFIEDENGTVWKFLQDWRKSVVFVTPQKAGGFSLKIKAKDQTGASTTYSLGGSATAGVNSGLKSLFSSYDTEYVFADNQLASEMTGILLLQKASDYKLNYKISFKQFPRIMFYGLKFKGIDDTIVSNTENGVLTYTVQLSCREVAAPSL